MYIGQTGSQISYKVILLQLLFDLLYIIKNQMELLELFREASISAVVPSIVNMTATQYGSPVNRFKINSSVNGGHLPYSFVLATPSKAMRTSHSNLMLVDAQNA